MKRFFRILALVFLVFSQFSGFGQEPTIQASGLNFTSVSSNSITVNWTRGNGTNVLIIARITAITAAPEDLSTYTASSVYGSGSAILGGFPTVSNYVVYIGTGTSVTVTNLTGGSQYEFYAFEFNGSGGTEDYLISFTGNNGKQYTAPSTQATNIVFSSIQTNSVYLNWNNGDGTSRVVLAKAGSAVDANPVNGTSYSNPSSTFGSGDQIGTGNYVLYNGLGNNVTVSGLTPGITYHFKVFGYVGSNGETTYKTDGFVEGSNPNNINLSGPPTTQTSNLTSSALSTTSFTLDFTRGNGDYVIILGKAATSIGTNPTDGVTYTADADFSSGTSSTIDGAKVLYIGTLSTIDITGLTAGTEYTFRAYEFYNPGGSPNYYTYTDGTNPITFSTLKNAPTSQSTAISFSAVQSNQVTFSWTNGDGDSRIVIGREGGAVTAFPSDATDYSSNTVFGSGYEVSTGNFVVYNSNSNSVTVTNLTANTTYYFKVFEYNNTGTDILFKTDGFTATNPEYTKTLPSTQASNLTFSNIANTSMDISWTRGDGDSILVVAKAGSTLAEIPSFGTIYHPDGIFGNGDQIDTDVFTVYTGTGTSTTVTGLTASNQYIFKAFEFNNGEPYTAYLTSDDSNNPAIQSTTGTEPSVQADNVGFTNTTSTQTDVTWTAGTGGSGRIVLAHEGSAVDASPVDGFSYTANATFGSGDEIGTGNFVVAIGNVLGETVTGLTPETTYHFKVFEYSGSGSSSNYLTTDGITNNPNNVTTAIGKPVTQASEVTFTNIGTDTYRVGWTRGSGENVLVVGVAGSFSASENPVDATTYTANSAFGTTGTELGSGYVVYNGNTPDYVDVTGLTAGTNYSFKVFEYNTPVSDSYYQTADGTNNPMSRYTLATEPTDQASSISFSSTGTTSVALSWTRGTPSGGSSIIVVARPSTDILTDPVDGTGYNANNDLSLAEVYATDHYIVFNGTGTGATITNLAPNTTYYFRAYEYNGSTESCNYLTSVGTSSNVTTIKTEPTLQASNLNFKTVAATSYTVNWTRGDAINNDGVIVLAKAGSAVDATPADGTVTYTADAAFMSGTEIGTGNYVVYKGTGTSVDITTLGATTEFFFRAFEYNNSGTAIDYLLTPDNSASQFTLSTEPSTQATSFTATPNTGDINLTWTSPSDGTGVLILARQTSAVNTTPTDAVNYSDNLTFGSGDVLNTDNYVVYQGSGTSATITGLASSTDYHFQIFNYDNTGAINYNVTSAPTDNANSGDKAAPTTQASAINFTSVGSTSMTINWTSGNGENRIVAVRETDQGTITPPSDGSTYTQDADGDWSTLTGTQLGLSGYYTMYNGNNNSVSITGLSPNTTYWVQIFEYNNGAGSELYLTTTETGNPASLTTLKAEPTVTATAISISNVASTSAQISWTNGTDGDGRIVVARLTATGNATPADGTTYTPNTTFGSGDFTGSGNYVIFDGVDGPLTVTGLTSGADYTFTIYEYNNSGTDIDYNATISVSDNQAATTTTGTITWDGSTDTDWNTATNWTPETVPSDGSYSVIIAAVTNQPIISSLSYSVENLTINAGASVTISSGATLNVSGDATLLSPSDNGRAGQIVNQGTFSVTGNSTMQRYYPLASNWRLVSSPLANPKPTDWAGYYVNSYNESTVNWSQLNSASSVSQAQGVSVYQASGSNLRTFTDASGFGDGSVILGITNTSPGDNSYGWNLVGNPYPSAINWTTAYDGQSNIDASIYIYDSGSGSYITCNTSSCAPSGSPIIEAGQGFYIHASGGGYLSLENSYRVAGSQTFMKSASTMPLIRIAATNEFYTSEALLSFDGTATDFYDSEFDAYKMFASNDTIAEIYFHLDIENDLVINTLNSDYLNLNGEETIEIPLGLTQGLGGAINIHATSLENIPDNIFVYLFDSQFNRYINLRNEGLDVYLQQVDNNRFKVVLSVLALGIEQNIESKTDMIFYVTNRTVYIKSDQFLSNNGFINIYDLSGKLIDSQSTSNANIQQVKINHQGTYILKVITNESITNQKIIVQ